MKTDTKEKILEIINTYKKVRPNDLMEKLGISLVAIHKHLKNLIETGQITKTGAPPLAFYQLSFTAKPKTPSLEINQPLDLIENHFLYYAPDGQKLSGAEGFFAWAKKTRQFGQIQNLIQEYNQIRSKADQFFGPSGLIAAKEKFTQTFGKTHLDEVYYQDFYSLPKFGKPRMGQMVLQGKQSQNKKLIQDLARAADPHIQQLIQDHKIEAIAWVPHSIPRKLPSLKELKRHLKIPLPEISLVKSYKGSIPIAQKSLAKLEERIANARETIFIKDLSIPFRRILLIDDAVGSGATLNEIAKKLKEDYQVSFLTGFVLVGSYKGFEVIREV